MRLIPWFLAGLCLSSAAYAQDRPVICQATWGGFLGGYPAATVTADCVLMAGGAGFTSVPPGFELRVTDIMFDVPSGSYGVPTKFGAERGGTALWSIPNPRGTYFYTEARLAFVNPPLVVPAGGVLTVDHTIVLGGSDLYTVTFLGIVTRP